MLLAATNDLREAQLVACRVARNAGTMICRR
jgi:hypothetical protein